LGRVPSTAFKAVWRKLDERDRAAIARAIREYLELSNWTFAMGPPATSNKPPPDDPYETAIEQAISTCGGDTRSALKSLLVANEFLEAELRILQGASSNGYSRGGISKKSN
jgi:hypothetical protein